MLYFAAVTVMRLLYNSCADQQTEYQLTIVSHYND